MDDETPTTRPSGPAAEPTTSDAELSRIAREAVRQPADPRMDRQLARMGLTDDPVEATPRPSLAAASATDAERIGQLERRIRRFRMVIAVLVVAVVVLAAALVIRISG